MLCYHRIGVSKSKDINKINASGECRIFCMSYFFTVNYRFQTNKCNGFHTEVAIISVKRNGSRMHE